MANFEIIMPKLGESIIEATITRWLKKAGDQVVEDETIVELATDKVDSEIPSPVAGTMVKTLFEEGDVVPVGKVIALIDTGGQEEETVTEPATPKEVKAVEPEETVAEPAIPKDVKAIEPKETVAESKKPEVKTIEPEEAVAEPATPEEVKATGPAQPPVEKVQEADNAADAANMPGQEADETISSDRFYSPLVRSMAREENISLSELSTIPGSGKDGRLTKEDMVSYLASQKTHAKEPAKESPPAQATKSIAPPLVTGAQDRVVEMDRMRRMIADHMVMSKQVSPHVTSFIETDVTSIVQWREKSKEEFLKRTGQKITYTPFFVETAAKVLREFPNVNASVDGYKIIQRGHVNIGIAAALPDGNLIVPVIKDADQKNLAGMAKEVNELADKARSNKLNPDDIQGGTFTITNFGTFDSLTGTPIINQPQVAILGIGAIKKRPWILETSDGDVIAIRSICMLSLSYDHRVVDGALAGQFLKRMKQLLEGFEGF